MSKGETLDLPNWTETEIRSMPATHKCEWADGNGIIGYYLLKSNI